MNALDSLFDFATLMSTSSAMTLISESNDLNESAQDTQTFKTRPATAALAQSCQMPHHSQHIDDNIHQLPQTEHPIVMFSRAHFDSGNQHPFGWIPEPLCSQRMPMQVQHPPVPEYSRLPAYETPAFDCYGLPCGHHPSQRCHCNFDFPPSRRYLQGSVPSAGNAQHLLLGPSGPELQYFQQLPVDVLIHGEHALERLLPPHCFYEDGSEITTPHSVALQYKNCSDTGLGTGCLGTY